MLPPLSTTEGYRLRHIGDDGGQDVPAAGRPDHGGEGQDGAAVREQYPAPRPTQRRAVLAAAVQKADPVKCSRLQTRLSLHLQRFAVALGASLEKELVSQLQVAVAAEESRKKAKK